MSKFLSSAEQFFKSHGIHLHLSNGKLECPIKIDGHLSRFLVGQLKTKAMGFTAITLMDISIPSHLQADVMELVIRLNHWFHLGQILLDVDKSRITARVCLPLTNGDLTDKEFNFLLVNCMGMLNKTLPRLEKVMNGTATPADAAEL